MHSGLLYEPANLRAIRVASTPEALQYLPAVSVLSAAGIAGPLYWIAIFPVDVIKSSMQTDSIIKSERVYPTMLEAAKVSLQMSASRALY